MKALTIWQPWASLIAIGAKPYEFRSWEAPRYVQGQRIAIHAGARPLHRAEVQELLLRLNSDEAWTTCLRRDLALALLERALTSPGILPTSAIVATAVLGVPLRGYEVVGEFNGPTINDSDRDKHADWAWPLRQIEALAPPIEAKGAQGFWNWGAA